MSEICKAELKEVNFPDIKNMMNDILLEYGYHDDVSVKYIEFIKTALLEWQHSLDDSSQFRVCCEDKGRDIVLSFYASGKKVKLIGKEIEVNEIKTGYARGCNEIRIRLPKENYERILFRRTLIGLMVPISFQILIQNIATSVDTIMLGYVDSSSMSSVALASSFTTIHMMVMEALTVGETVLIAQYFGNRDIKNVNAALSFSVKAGFVISLIFVAAGLLFPETIMSFYTSVPSYIEGGAVYIRYISLSFLIIPVYRAYYCFMRTTGHIKPTLYFSIAGCALNILLNAILIFGMLGIEPMGVMGAGISTVASSVFQLILVLIYSRKILWQIVLSIRCKNREISGLFISKTLPVFLQYGVWLVGNNITVSAFGHMGEDITSANALITSVYVLFLSVGSGIGSSAGILIGGNLGRSEFDEALRRSGYSFAETVKVALVVVALFALTMTALTFTSIDLSDGARVYFWYLLIACCINGFFEFMNSICINGCLYAGGDSMYILIVDACIMGIVMIPVSLISIFSDILPLIPVMMILKNDEILTFPLKYYRVKKKKWLVNITLDKE